MLRMIAPFVASSLLLLAIGVGAAWQVHRWQRTVEEEIRVNVGGLRAAEELEIAVREIRTRLDQFLITGERIYLDVLRLRPETERWLAEAERWSLTDKEQKLTGRARRGYTRFLDDLDRVKVQSAGPALAGQVRRLIDEVLIKEILQPVHEYLDVNEEELERATERNQVFAAWLKYVLLLLGICGSGAGLVAGIGFARGFHRSLIQLSVPIRAAAGHLEEVVGPLTFTVGRDLKELETVLALIAERIGAIIERLRQSEREALRAEQLAALGQMAAGMAHELRNPLTSMKLLVQQANTEDTWHEACVSLSRRDLGVLEEEINRLEGLTQSFLDFARPPQPEQRTIDVRPLVEQTIQVVSGRAAQGEIRIEYEPPAEPITAAVDPGQFRQVLLNLLLNGLDAIKGEGVLTVNLEHESDGWLTLKVSDNGCGFPVSLGNRLFTPFTTTKESGLGLGLSICKRIVEAHGGSITAENRPAGGAVFTVRLPQERRQKR
jgi:signal transduction histidine kinase